MNSQESATPLFSSACQCNRHEECVGVWDEQSKSRKKCHCSCHASAEVKSDAPTTSALSTQEGGSHYKGMAIQPAEYVTRNGIGYLAGSAIYYLSRYRSKNGVEDLRKAIHSIELLIELEYGRQEDPKINELLAARLDGTLEFSMNGTGWLDFGPENTSADYVAANPQFFRVKPQP